MAFLNRLIPFFIAGIVVTVLIFGLVLFAYIFMISAIVGLGLFAFNWIRARFFAPPKPIVTPKSSGRVIDSEEWHKL
jgi:hypothetical protein